MPSARTVAKVLGVVTAAAAGVLAVQEARRRIDASRGGAGPVSSSSRPARSAAMGGVERHAELDAAFELQTDLGVRAAAWGASRGAA